MRFKQLQKLNNALRRNISGALGAAAVITLTFFQPTVVSIVLHR